MHYDVVIIGAGMSGLAAGIRLAYFDKQVCIVERHYAYGGLNSYYNLGGREFDVGLHAVTNYVPPGVSAAPLSKLFRQLRISRDEFELCEQLGSEIRFPGRRIRFTNDFQTLIEEIAREFPSEVDGFRGLIGEIERFDWGRMDSPYLSSRKVLGQYIRDRVLIDMLLCPLMFYGGAEEHDMDFRQFAILFQSIFLEGFARPRGGVRTIIRALVKKFRALNGKLRMRCGVERIEVEADHAVAVTLQSGEVVTADTMISSAGIFETMRLCSDAKEIPQAGEPGQISFVESVCILDQAPRELGLDSTIIFFNDAETFTYAVPREDVDLRSGVACCPNNYEHHEDLPEGIFRVTWLANPKRWLGFTQEHYEAKKQELLPDVFARGEVYMPGFRERVVFTDLFTPRTIRSFTGHVNGAVYGAPRKIRDGRTRLKNLFICGTDQGYLGIIGAMMSGITMANLHVLAPE